jgi:transcriptional regulator with XRE-family HTH domain
MNSAVKEKIQEVLNHKSLTATEVEREVGIPLASLRNFLKGRVLEPRFDVIIKVTQYLKINLTDLISEKKIIQDEKEKTSLTAFHEWDKALFQSAVESVSKILEANQYKLCYDQVMPIIESAYLYSLEHKNKRIDDDFVAWSIKQINA